MLFCRLLLSLQLFLRAAQYECQVDWCVSEAEINAASNEGYESVAGEVNRASTNDDITLCENTLYARDPEYDEGRSQGIFIL